MVFRVRLELTLVTSFVEKLTIQLPTGTCYFVCQTLLFRGVLMDIIACKKIATIFLLKWSTAQDLNLHLLSSKLRVLVR